MVRPCEIIEAKKASLDNEKYEDEILKKFNGPNYPVYEEMEPMLTLLKLCAENFKIISPTGKSPKKTFESRVVDLKDVKEQLMSNINESKMDFFTTDLPLHMLSFLKTDFVGKIMEAKNFETSEETQLQVDAILTNLLVPW